ncbi:MAG: TPM domain-containing protein [Melioribacteraceae bacterium]|nr:TPM domain-containing protein [Melioribacteraceae bacterium]MDD3557600.1 TPM domain-containing protein [Melioribacteraceae bacterium]
MSRELLYQYFSDDDFLRISDKIKQAELKTSGEIRVSVKENKPLLKSKKTIKDLAEEEFYNLGMDKTRDKTGILLYISLKEKAFQILADSGINQKVEPNTWDELKDQLQKNFSDGKFTDGIIETIGAMGKILSEHFPIKQDDTNELSNKVEF